MVTGAGRGAGAGATVAGGRGVVGVETWGRRGSARAGPAWSSGAGAGGAFVRRWWSSGPGPLVVGRAVAGSCRPTPRARSRSRWRPSEPVSAATRWSPANVTAAIITVTTFRSAFVVMARPSATARADLKRVAASRGRMAQSERVLPSDPSGPRRVDRSTRRASGGVTGLDVASPARGGTGCADRAAATPHSPARARQRGGRRRAGSSQATTRPTKRAGTASRSGTPPSPVVHATVASLSSPPSGRSSAGRAAEDARPAHDRRAEGVHPEVGGPPSQAVGAVGHGQPDDVAAGVDARLRVEPDEAAVALVAHRHGHHDHRRVEPGDDRRRRHRCGSGAPRDRGRQPRAALRVQPL